MGQESFMIRTQIDLEEELAGTTEWFKNNIR